MRSCHVGVCILAAAVLLQPVPAQAETTELTASFTRSGTNSNGSTGTWTAQGSLTYQSGSDMGITSYLWAGVNSAKVLLTPGADYIDVDVRYRAVLIYGTNVIVWESSPQVGMDHRALTPPNVNTFAWTPDPSSWMGSTSVPVTFKVQSGAVGGTLDERHITLGTSVP